MSAALNLCLHQHDAPRAANDNNYLSIVPPADNAATARCAPLPRRSAKSITNRFNDLTHTDSGGPNRTLGYDNRGNVTSLGALNFVYDKSDQPVSISGSASGAYRYDGNFKRVKSVVNGKTIYNVYNAAGTLTLVDKATDGELVKYIGDFARVTNGVITYLHKDHLGSASTGTSQNGLIAWRQQFAPFGEELNTLPVNKDLAGFTGHIKDSATGLNYMQARYYDPMIGRFLSIDPIGFSVERPEMFGRYTLIRSLITANIGNLDINADDTFIESNLADYTAKEDITAGYFMFGTDIADLKLIAGVRVEHTDYEGLGRDVRLFEEDSVLDPTSVPASAECRDKDGNPVSPVAGVLGDDLICIADARNSDSYTDVLPSIVLKLDATDNLVLRASYYKSLARPNFKSIVPSANINQNDDNEFEGEFGNITAFGIPKLEHQSANSFDLSAEYYTDNGGVISAGVFHKNFNNFISELKAKDFVTSFATFDEAFYSVNLNGANLTGIELNVQQPLDFLPGAMSGLIFGANYAYIDGEATNLNGQQIALPKQSSNIGNLVLGYDKYGFDTRIALSYRDEYLDEVDGRTIDAHTQIDVSAKYKINDNFQIFGDITNLTDEPFVAFDRDGERKLLNQFETYGRTFEMGLRYKY